MWINHKKLNRISGSISGCLYNGKEYRVPHYVRYNPNVRGEDSLECCADNEGVCNIINGIDGTVGVVEIVHKTDAEDCITVNNKAVSTGRFSSLFEYGGYVYVIENYDDMGVCSFRLLKIIGTQTVETVVDSKDLCFCKAATENGDSENRQVSIKVDTFCIDRDITGSDAIFLLCSGVEFHGDKEIRCLVVYNPSNKEHPVIKVDIPAEKLEYSDANSMWTDGIMLAVGCDKQVVMLYLPTMDVEYWTLLDKNIVSAFLIE